MLLEEIQFASVHVRRTDYLEHIKILYKNASAAPPEFYLNAFTWLKKRVRSPLIFIVLSDDPKWAMENILSKSPDAFMPGKYDLTCFKFKNLIYIYIYAN